MIVRTNSATIAVWSSLYLVATAASVVPRQNEQVIDSSAWNKQFRVAGGANLISESVQEIPTTNKEEENNKALEEDEPWRKKKDWWKDPLSMFDENDEFVDPDIEAEKEQKRKEEEEARIAAEKAREEELATAAASDVDSDNNQEKNEGETESETIEFKKADVNSDKHQGKSEGQPEATSIKGEPEGTEKEEDTESEQKGESEHKKAALVKAADDKEQEAREQQRLARIQAEQERKELDKLKKEQVKLQQELLETKKEKEMQQQQKKMQQQREPKKSEGSSVQASAKTGSTGKRLHLQKLKTSLPAGISVASLSQLSTSFPVLTVFATFSLGKIIMEKMIRKKRDSSEVEKDEMDEDDLELENLPFRQEPVQFSEPVHYTEEDLAEESDVGSDVEHEDTTTSQPQQTSGGMNTPSVPRYQQENRFAKASSSPPFLSGLKSALGGGSKVTFEELEHMRLETERALAEKQAMEQEYEKTSFQLKEVQSEVTQLTSTTKYLQSQLRDYEEMMDRTIRNERKKAKVELRRMKELMEATREKDRAALRRQFTKELERMQAQYEQALEDKEAGDNSTRKAIK